MLASARRSACRPAPLVGSVAANVRTAGREGTDSFMEVAGCWGVTLETRLALRAPTGGRYDASGSARVLAFYSTNLRVRLCLQLRLLPNRGLSRCGAASHAASSTTRPKAGPRTASP